MSTMTLVRNAIAVSHNQIEQTAFSIAMMNGSVNIGDYARGLNQLRAIHEALEKSIAESPDAARFFSSEMARTATIDRDLRSFGLTSNTFALLPEAIAIVKQIDEWEVSSPTSLLGCLYVLEGSRMGSLVIAKPLAKALGLASGSSSGIEYHTEGASETPMRVRRLKEQIDQSPFDASAVQQIVTGATVFMEMLTTLYQALPIHVPSAGAHAGRCPISGAKRELHGDSQLKSA